MGNLAIWGKGVLGGMVKRRKSEDEKLVKSIKLSRRTFEELERARGLMIFHFGRNVTYDEVIRAILMHAPKGSVTISVEEEEKEEEG